MPIQIKTTKPKADEPSTDEAKKLALFKESGELTLAGQTVADFLEAADFDPLFNLEAGQPYVVNPDVSEDDPYAVHEEGDEEGGDDEEKSGGDAAKDDDSTDDADDKGDGEGEEAPADGDDSSDDEEGDDEEGDEAPAEAIMPGLVAAQLVETDDLADMFGFYLGSIGAEIDEADEDAPGLLERKAVLAVFADVLEDDGRTIKEDRKAEVIEWLTEMLSEGTVSTDEVVEAFLTKSQRVKRAKKARKPKTGTQRAKLKKRRRERKKNKSKVARQEKQFRRKRASRLNRLQKERSETALVFGRGWGLDEADLLVGVREGAELELTREQLIALDEQYGLTVTCPSDDCEHEAAITAFIDEKKMKRKKGKKGSMMGGMSYESVEEPEEGEVAEMKMKCPKCGHTYTAESLDEKKKLPPAFLKNKKGKKDADGDADGSKKGEKDESAKASPFAIGVGRPNIDEGASLAGSVLGTMGVGRKTLTEDGEG